PGVVYAATVSHKKGPGCLPDRWCVASVDPYPRELMIGGNWLTESLSGVVSATMSRRSKASNGSAPWGRAQRWVGGL
ncbi:hypothetical protein LCGC14_2764930, partial [marine sediment metagenome]